MLDSFLKTIPMPPDPRRNEFPLQPASEIGGDDRLVKLREQEQFWFSWLTVLHERLSKVRPGETVAAEGQKVLEIARRRWLEAKEALAEHHAGD
jgi:hypothetical protein